MTPKEKAKELYNHFAAVLSSTTAKHRIKKCATIAIETVFYSYPTFPTMNDEFFSDYIDERISAEDYWNEVKKEIEQL